MLTWTQIFDRLKCLVSPLLYLFERAHLAVVEEDDVTHLLHESREAGFVRDLVDLLGEEPIEEGIERSSQDRTQRHEAGVKPRGTDEHKVN